MVLNIGGKRRGIGKIICWVVPSISKLWTILQLKTMSTSNNREIIFKKISDLEYIGRILECRTFI